MQDNKLINLETQWSGTLEVQMEINNYSNNNGMYIGILSRDDDGEGFECYGDITVNLENKAPDYCAYVDINNMPEMERFIVDNDLGEFTGITQKSGYCEYPLYLFNVDKLRELCPEGMAFYETNIGATREPQKNDMVR